MKPAWAAGAVGALLIGGVALATSRNSSSNVPVDPAPQQAIQPLPTAAAPLYPDTGFQAQAGAAPAPVTAEPVATAAPVRERVVYRDRVVYRNRTVARRRAHVVRTTRPGHKSALIIGGSTVGGAVVGGIVGGKKGALIGGLIGGAGGTVYDRKTRHKRRVVYR
jgi:hypothetical protein